MHSDLIFKIQLVTSTGLNLASVPSSEDTSMAQLSGGMMSAILTFSREVHDRDIEFMSYHDRSVLFVQVSNMIFVIEISSTLDKELMHTFVSKFKEQVKPHIRGIDVESLDTVQAEIILKEIYNSEWLHNMIDELGFERSLADASIGVFEVNHKNDGNILLKEGSLEPYYDQIAYMIHEKNSKGKIKDDFSCGFLMLTEHSIGLFVVSQNRSDSSSVGVLSVDETISDKLFRMTPLLMKNAMNKLKNNKSYSFTKLFNELKSTHDIDPTERLKEIETTKPLTYLDKKINNIDSLLFPVVSGEQIVVIGEIEEVKNFIDLILVFNQHLITDVLENFQGGEKISNDMTGMSKTSYTKLQKSNTIPKNAIIVDLHSGQVKGPNAKSNKFLKNLFNRTKNLSYTQAVDVIYKELELLISYALTATSYAVLSKTEALNKLENLKSSINDNSQYEIIQLLATKQNAWLKSIVYDTSFDSDWI